MSSVSSNPNPTPQHNPSFNHNLDNNNPTSNSRTQSPNRADDSQTEILELNLTAEDQKILSEINEIKQTLEIESTTEPSLAQYEQEDLKKINNTKQMNEIETQAISSINEFSEQISKIIKNNLENPNFLSLLELEEESSSIDSTDVIKAALLGKEAADALNPNIGDNIQDINSSVVLSGTLLLISNWANLPDKLDQITKLEEIITKKEKELDELRANPTKNKRQIELLENEIIALKKKKDSVTETTYNNLVKATLRAAKNDTKTAAEILQIMGGVSSAEKFLTFCGSLLGGIYQAYKITNSIRLLKEYSEERELILKELNQISTVLSEKKTDPALKTILETRKKSLDQQYLENGKNTIEKTLLLSSYSTGFASSGLAIGGYLGAATAVGAAGISIGAASGVLFLGGLAVGGAYLVLKNREKIHGTGKRFYIDTKLKIAKKKETDMKSSISENQAQSNLNNHTIRELEREINTRDIYYSKIIPREIESLKEKIQVIDSLIEKKDPDKKEISSTNDKYILIENKIKELTYEGDKKGFDTLFVFLEINESSIKNLESNLNRLQLYINKEKRKEIPLIEVEPYETIAIYLTKKLALYKEANKLKKEIEAVTQIDSVFVKRYKEITKNKSNSPQGIQKQIDKVRNLIRSINQKIAKSPGNKVLSKALKDYEVIHEHLLNKKDLTIQKIRRKEEMDKMILANDKRKKCVSVSKKINNFIKVTMQKLGRFKTTLEKLGNRSQELKNRKIDEKYATELGLSLSQFKKEKAEIKKKLDEDTEFRKNTTNYLKQFPGLIKSKTIENPSSEELLTAIFDYSTKKVK